MDETRKMERHLEGRTDLLTFRQQKTATAVARCEAGQGLVSFHLLARFQERETMFCSDESLSNLLVI
jgi:hypothetical protein